MTLLPEEIQDYSQKVLEYASTRRLKLEQAQAQGEQMSVLTATPEWESYGRKLEAEISRAKAIKERIEKLFLDPSKVLSPADYMEAKIHQGQAAAYLDALNFALNVAKTLIEQGEKAVAELNLLDAS
jgi:hypothetical protein